ncbi:MAG TPA: sugar phosphate nucleotidyltransferase [Fimbriimonadaceae bacterium]|nr:sugar phosphate nucleotidyltransferase [Fimbriimonadaceae bacterium]
MIAVLPAAGKGTRMSGVTAASKELLGVGGKPVLQWSLEEAEGAGCGDAVVVVSPAKPDLGEFMAGRPGKVVLQESATGLAPALILAAGVEPVLLILPDTIFYPESPSPRLVRAISRGFDVAIAVEPVSEADVHRYGIVEWSRENGRISRILEKPQPEETSSRWAIAGRFAMSANAMDFVRRRVAERAGSGREIDLPPILSEAIAAGQCGLAVPLEGKERRLDCGNPEGYRLACEVVDGGL